MNRGRVLGLGLLVLLSGHPLLARPLQNPVDPLQAETAAQPLPGEEQGGAAAPAPGMVAGAEDNAAPRLAQLADQPVRPLNEGPLHEAFLSPRKDRNPVHVQKTPPQPISERPAVDPPSASAQWIEGYWEWDAGRKDFLWVTGTWRVAPPGRFWVNGYWKRDQDGWYRVPGFWTDRKTDRLDYRKNGPPQERPDDEPGEPPAPDCFYIPGQYYPDGDGVVWKKGFWTKAQPGWSWVPAQWNRQPEGWVFQDGYWDRTLEDRGTLFAPAEADKSAKGDDGLTYQPYTQISPEMYGQLYGAFGRPNSNYDGYPGVYYDDDGRYYGYANYGTLGGYYGYLDYPYYGGYGYPYITTPVDYGYGYGGYGYGYPITVMGSAAGCSAACSGLAAAIPITACTAWVDSATRWIRGLSADSGYGGCGYGGYGGYGGFGYGGLGLGFGFGYPFFGGFGLASAGHSSAASASVIHSSAASAWYPVFGGFGFGGFR